MAGTQPAETEQIGRYRIEGTLGRGAMGVIYRAHDPVIDRRVAIKLVRADLLDGTDRSDYVARFQQEAQAAGRCTHPNIVGVYDYALHEGNPYIAMEYIDGITLAQVNQRTSRLAIAEAADLAGQMLDALDAAHRLGVVHRDIKPANIMLTPQNRVKVTDFGISRLDTSRITGPGSVVGTPSYMSPEQCRGEGVDARSDLFSAGVVLYELITGVRPFAGQSPHEVWHRLLTEEPAGLATLRPDAPAALQDVVGRSLAKRAGDRFASASAMAAALRGVAGREASVATSTTGTFDRTVMAPPGSGGFTLDSEALVTIERRLASHVGPIAGYLLKNAMRVSGDLETLCRVLSDNIEDQPSRQRFNRDVQAQLHPSLVQGTSGKGQTTLSDAELQRAQAELTRFVGPVARVLVKHGAPGCLSVAQLWERLAQHIDVPADRAAFLRKL